MGAPSPLSVLSGALKIAQVYGYHGRCWGQDSLEFLRLGGRAGHRRAAGSIKGQLYLLPEPGTAKFKNISRTAYTRRVAVLRTARRGTTLLSPRLVTV
jgi:hypothetical protein